MRKKSILIKIFIALLILGAILGITLLAKNSKDGKLLKGQVSGSLLANGGKVTLEEYSDFQCPACVAAASVVSELKKKYGDRLEIIFNDYPLPYHQWAKKASEAAALASDQGKFWEYHDILFERQQEWTKSSDATLLFKEYAKELGLDTEKFNKSLDSGEKEGYINDRIKKGEEAGIEATPTFYLNGKKLSGFKTWDEFIQRIEKELNAK
jgi:protein-disulfide isomerase